MKWASQGLMNKIAKKTLRLLVKLQTLLPIPIPVQFPWGSWWLTWGDVMGQHLLWQDGFEQAEQNFLLRFLKPGMVVIDAGAHQGLYTLLA